MKPATIAVTAAILAPALFALGAANAQSQPMQHDMHRNMQGQMQQKMQGNMPAGQKHSGHDMSSMPAKGDTGPASAGYRAANARMHTDMDITYSGDADVDFVKGMIPHHQGAIDMAKVLIGFGKDPELKKLGEGIIAAQEKEIAMMKEWLKKAGK